MSKKFSFSFIALLLTFLAFLAWAMTPMSQLTGLLFVLFLSFGLMFSRRSIKQENKSDKIIGFFCLTINLIFVILIIFNYWWLPKEEAKNIQNLVACTLETKLCYDGFAVGRTGLNCEFAECPIIKTDESVNSKDIYFFKSISEANPQRQKYSDYSIEIYKNQQLIKKVSIKEIKVMIEPTLFTVSPDQKYVAFKTVGYGGTCVYFASPVVIDLNNFSIVNLDNSDINKKLENILGIDPGDSKNNFSAVQEIEDIKWISNTTIEVTMKFGDKDGCAILVYPKPANFPLEIETKVDFIIIK
jgi:hypothetical protein